MSRDPLQYNLNPVAVNKVVLLESCIISLFASVPFSSACSVDSESVKMTMFAIARGFVSKVWLMCVTDVLIASCSAT